MMPRLRATSANVLVVEPRYADPLSLVHYKKVLVTEGRRSSNSRRCSA
jgi:hypothetical protein